MSDRKDVIERLRKLMARSVANGCTEAEATSAAEAVARLMAEHGLSADDVEMDERRSPSRSAGGSLRDMLWVAVAQATNCAMHNHEGQNGCSLVWIGRAPGPEIAVYLHVMLRRAIDRELKLYRETPAYKRKRSAKVKRQLTDEFTVGIVRRLAGRVLRMFAATSNEQARLAAESAQQRQNPKLQTVALASAPKKMGDGYWSGRSAGDRVGLHHGVGGDAGAAGALSAPLRQIEGPAR